MSNATRRISGLSLIVIGLLAAACSTSTGAATGTPGATGTVDGTETSTATAAATSVLPDWVQARIDSGDLDGNGTADELERYVAGTGGGGVSHRTACEDSARLDTVWAEGTQLEVVASNSSECDGWTLVTDGETTSWVLDKYLEDTEPAPAITGGASSAGGGAAVGNGWVQVLQYQQWQIPVSGLRVAEVGETWCEAPSWHDPAGGSYVTKTVEGTPFVNPDPQRCGFGMVGDVALIWVAAP